HSGRKIRPRHWTASQLLEEHRGVSERTPLAAIGFGNDDAEPAQLRHLAEQLRRYPCRSRFEGNNGLFGVLLLDKIRRRGFEQLLRFGQSEIHVTLPLLRRATA